MGHQIQSELDQRSAVDKVSYEADRYDWGPTA